MRIGTLLGQHDRPEAQVQIVRKGPKTTRVRQQIKDGHHTVWDTRESKIDSARVLDDGGELWRKHNHDPKSATWIGSTGAPIGRLKVQRLYKTVIKAKIYLGELEWSQIEDFRPDQVRFDGGAGWGWKPPAHQADESVATDRRLPPAGDETSAPQMKKQPGAVGQRVSYLRVSSVDQNLARQREAIGTVDREFVDRLSARSRADRPGLEECIAYLRGGDRLVVASIDRLARSLVDLRQVIDQITSKGASVHFLKEHLTFSAEGSDPRSVLMLGILGSFAEFERSIIRERQAEGIAVAKKAGKYTGRKRALSPGQVQQARERVAAGEAKAAIARDLGVGRATLYRALAQPAH